MSVWVDVNYRRGQPLQANEGNVNLELRWLTNYDSIPDPAKVSEL
jgi:hypothetical protein